MDVYLSGQISGLDFEVVKDLFQNAREHLESYGYGVVSPLDNGLPIESEWHDHMLADLRILSECEAIAMLPNWEKSEGAKIELAFAKKMQLKILILSPNVFR